MKFNFLILDLYIKRNSFLCLKMPISYLENKKSAEINIITNKFEWIKKILLLYRIICSVFWSIIFHWSCNDWILKYMDFEERKS